MEILTKISREDILVDFTVTHIIVILNPWPSLYISTWKGLLFSTGLVTYFKFVTYPCSIFVSILNDLLMEIWSDSSSEGCSHSSKLPRILS